MRLVDMLFDTLACAPLAKAVAAAIATAVVLAFVVVSVCAAILVLAF